jgi:hypothetical protein
VGAWVSYSVSLQVVNPVHILLVVAVGAWVSYWSEVQVVWGVQASVLCALGWKDAEQAVQALSTSSLPVESPKPASHESTVYGVQACVAL